MTTRNLIKVSDIPRNPEIARGLPAKSTLFKWHHIQRHPSIFRKIGRSLYVDLDEFFRLVDAGKLT